MKQNQLKKWSISIVLLLSVVVLAACGRDTSTVDSALEGHWEATDMKIDDNSLVDIYSELGISEEEMSDYYTVDENGDVQWHVDFYFDGENMTTIMGDGTHNVQPYTVSTADEENNSVVIEVAEDNEYVTSNMIQTITYGDEERTTASMGLEVSDITVKDNEETASLSEEERELYDLSMQYTTELLAELNMSYDIQYVDDEEPPAPEETESGSSEESEDSSTSESGEV